MGRDDNVLKGRQAERIAQGVRDYIAAFMANAVNPVGNAETLEVEGLEVVYDAETQGETSSIGVIIRDKSGNAPFRQVKVEFEFEH